MPPLEKNFKNFVIAPPLRRTQRGYIIMVVYEKIYFKAYTNDLYISYKNNISQFYFILGRAELHWNFSSILKDGFDIHRFSNRKLVLTMCSVGNL